MRQKDHAFSSCYTCSYVKIHSIGLVQNQNVLDLFFSLNSDGFGNKVSTMGR